MSWVNFIWRSLPYSCTSEWELSSCQSTFRYTRRLSTEQYESLQLLLAQRPLGSNPLPETVGRSDECSKVLFLIFQDCFPSSFCDYRGTHCWWRGALNYAPCNVATQSWYWSVRKPPYFPTLSRNLVCSDWIYGSCQSIFSCANDLLVLRLDRVMRSY